MADNNEHVQLPARYQAQVWVDDNAVDTSEGTTTFDAQFYLAQLHPDTVDDMCDPKRHDLDNVDQTLFDQALEYGTVSAHNGPYFIYLPVGDIRAWRERYRTQGLCTPGEVRAALEDSGCSEAIALAVTGDTFDSHELLPASEVQRVLDATGRELSGALQQYDIGKPPAKPGTPKVSI